MKKFSRVLVLANMLILLGYFVWSVYSKEQIRRTGNLVLLELAPADPRSLIQGDYMRLNYAITAGVDYRSIPAKGFFVVRTDNHNVGHKISIQEKSEPLKAGELLIKYKVSGDGLIRIGPDSWFFQEGRAEIFAKAKYGALKTDSKGNSILTGLYDEHFRRLN